MTVRSKHITLFFGLFMAAIGQLWAQGQALEPEHWLPNKSENTFEHKVLESLENLKRAEANMDDSLTVAWLDSIGYLSIAQSGFKGMASDENQRKGWWLLSYPVAVKHGLVINSVIDERMDLVKSTQAAFRYWQELVAQYGSSDMADLVFVESPLAVSKFLNDSVNFPEQAQKVSSAEEKVKEVKSLFVANKNTHPVGPSVSVESVESNASISFEVLHHFLQVPTSELRELNPQWVSEVYDPGYGMLTIPSSVSEAFASKLKEMEQRTRDDKVTLAAANEKRIKQLKGNIPDLNTYKPISYKVKMGDNLGRIAQRYHVYISDLRAWNGLKSDRIYAGQRMTIYIPKNQTIAPAPAVVKKKPDPKPLAPGEYEEYTVKQGDTLWAISQKYGHVSIENIMADNGIGENISPGQVLKIRKQ